MTRLPVQEAAEAYLAAQYGSEDIPLAYRDVIETAFADALCDVESLDEWSRNMEWSQAIERDEGRREMVEPGT